MSFYDDVAADASSLLVEFGATCSLGEPVESSYNTATGSKTYGYTDYDVTACVFDYPQKFIDGTLIRQGDKRALVSVSGLTVTPKAGQRFTDSNDVAYGVISAKSIAPAGSAVLWVLQVRK